MVNFNYELVGSTYDCYKNLFNRDSYDNAGTKLVSSVHYGTNVVNAYWTGTQLWFGAASVWQPNFSDAAGWDNGPEYYSTIRFAPQR